MIPPPKRFPVTRSVGTVDAGVPPWLRVATKHMRVSAESHSVVPLRAKDISPMNRSTLQIVIAFTAALLLPPPAAIHAAENKPAKPAKPNVLFLFTDDQRVDTIEAPATPTSGRRTSTSCAVRHGVHPGLHGRQQGAVCVPSRAMLLSGRTLFRVDDNLKGETTWPAKFGHAGYATFITGKWHNWRVRPAFVRQGHAVFFGGMGNPYKLPLRTSRRPGSKTDAPAANIRPAVRGHRD